MLCLLHELGLPHAVIERQLAQGGRNKVSAAYNFARHPAERREIRVREDSGAFRVIYVAKFSEAIYVLHAFQKKAQKTPKAEIELARKRYRAMLNERKVRWPRS